MSDNDAYVWEAMWGMLDSPVGNCRYCPVSPFWYWLTCVVLDKGPLNVCVYVLCHLAVLQPVAADKLVAVRDRRCGQTLKLTAVNRNNFVLILMFKVKFSIVISLLCYARKTAC